MEFKKYYLFKILFEGCSSLLVIPDISKWKINTYCNVKKMFYGCSSLMTYPDISEWNISAFTKAEDIFELKFFKSEVNSKSSSVSKSIIENLSEYYDDCLSVFSNPEINENNNGQKIETIIEFQNNLNQQNNVFNSLNRDNKINPFFSLFPYIKTQKFSKQNYIFRRIHLNYFKNIFNLENKDYNKKDCEDIFENFTKMIILSLLPEEEKSKDIEEKIENYSESDNNDFINYYYNHFYDE